RAWRPGWELRDPVLAELAGRRAAREAVHSLAADLELGDLDAGDVCVVAWRARPVALGPGTAAAAERTGGDENEGTAHVAYSIARKTRRCWRGRPSTKLVRARPVPHPSRQISRSARRQRRSTVRSARGASAPADSWRPGRPNAPLRPGEAPRARDRDRPRP